MRAIDNATWPGDHNFVDLVVGLVSLYSEHRLVTADVCFLGVESDIVLVDVDDFLWKAGHKKDREFPPGL